MADRGIIFSAPMVRALLDGRKTQTRRLITPRGKHSLFDGSWADPYVLDPGNAAWRSRELPHAPGDRLYVREAWTVSGIYTDVVEVGYRASETRSHTEYVEQWPVAAAVPGKGKWPEWPKYGPSIHMPRWASRLWLAVSDVQVQRLQDISEADAIAEGAQIEATFADYRSAYGYLWNSLHTAEGTRWEDNPWIYAVTFAVNHGNIDAAGEA